MFQKLDADGGGTLSIQEITSLFIENGIHMSREEVADMFANAQRKHMVTKHRKQEQTGGGHQGVMLHDLEQKPTEINLKRNLSPEQFKIVASSPSALKEVKHGLKQFKEDLKTKKMLYNYVPVTMDELMTRFLHNIHRNEYMDDLTQNRQLLELNDLKSEHDEAISQGVEKSMQALANLIN